MRGDYKDLIRDCLAKLDKIDINEKTWDDIIDEYELEYSSDHLRKISYGFRMYRDAFNEDNNNIEDMLNMKKEKVKIQDLKNLANKKIRELSRAESMIELIQDNIDRLSESKPFLSDFKFKPTSSGRDMIVILSDVHLGLEFKHCANEYSPEICYNRINRYVDKAIEYSNLYNIDKVHLVCLGDIISGTIHNTIRLQSRYDLAEQIVESSELISEIINKLANNVPYVTVSICNGNHERIYEKDNALATDNYTKIIKHTIIKRCKDLSNVVFLDNTLNDDEICYLNIHGYNFLGCHGDKIKKQKVADQLRNVTGIEPNYVLLGHMHVPEQFCEYNVKIYQNGCVVGSDEYSIGKKLSTDPQQKILIVSNEGVIADCDVNLK